MTCALNAYVEKPRKNEKSETPGVFLTIGDRVVNVGASAQLDSFTNLKSACTTVQLIKIESEVYAVYYY